jgi:hypothetical protein
MIAEILRVGKIVLRSEAYHRLSAGTVNNEPTPAKQSPAITSNPKLAGLDSY